MASSLSYESVFLKRQEILGIERGEYIASCDDIVYSCSDKEFSNSITNLIDEIERLEALKGKFNSR
jgi:hypothetical protein